MSLKQILLTASALALLTGGAFADGGPVPEEPPAPPAEPAPPPEEEPAAPPPPAEESWLRPAFYLGAGGGVDWMKDMEFLIDDEFEETWLADGDTGWMIAGTAGFRYGYGIRGEVEIGYRQHDAELSVFGDLLTDGVEIDVLSVMLNLLYEFELSPSIIPYVGGGIGQAFVEVEDPDLLGKDEDWSFAYQLIAGLTVPLPNSSAELFADYRWFATTHLELDFDGMFADNDDYRAHTVMAGFRYNFW